MENTEETMRVVMAAVMMVAEYVLVLAAVLADLWSGLRKARRRGEARRSEALRRTVMSMVARRLRGSFSTSRARSIIPAHVPKTGRPPRMAWRSG